MHSRRVADVPDAMLGPQEGVSASALCQIVSQMANRIAPQWSRRDQGQAVQDRGHVHLQNGEARTR